VGRWQVIVDSVLADLETTALGTAIFRIGKSIFEGEDIAANHTDPADANETPAERKQAFQMELRAALREKLAQDPSNAGWKEALKLLDNPTLRFPEHR
jgi:hypothetical protein